MSTRASLRAPAFILAIHKPIVDLGSTVPDSYNAAYDRVDLFPKTTVQFGNVLPKKVGSLPVPDENVTFVAMDMKSATLESREDFSVFRTFSNHEHLYIERNSAPPGSLYELVSPDDKAGLIAMENGSVINMKEGDIIVTMSRRIDTCSSSICLDHVNTVMVALPELHDPDALKAVMNPHHMAHMRKRVKDFLVNCSFDYSNKPVIDPSGYASYKQDMGRVMELFNGLNVNDPYGGAPFGRSGAKRKSEDGDDLAKKQCVLINQTADHP